jgi:hypothetical protein
MGLGGPVWHVSAAPIREWSLGEYPRDSLKAFALKALGNVGDELLGQWEEYTRYAFHIRRRLSSSEEASIGPVIDIRCTLEAERRVIRVQRAVQNYNLIETARQM